MFQTKCTQNNFCLAVTLKERVMPTEGNSNLTAFFYTLGDYSIQTLWLCTKCPQQPPLHVTYSLRCTFCVSPISSCLAVISVTAFMTSFCKSIHDSVMSAISCHFICHHVSPKHWNFPLQQHTNDQITRWWTWHIVASQFSKTCFLSIIIMIGLV